MYRSLKATASVSTHPQAVAIAMYGGASQSLPKAYRLLDRQWGGALAAAIKRPEFTRDAGSVTCLYPEGGTRLFVLGLGDKKSFREDTLRACLGSLLQNCFTSKVTKLHLELSPGLGHSFKPEPLGRLVGEMLIVSNFSFESCKGTAGGSGSGGGGLNLSIEVEQAQLAQVRRGLTVGRSANYARTLAATPPNIANPAYLVKQCKAMARKVGLKCSIIDAKKAQAMGMGGLVAVGAGGSTPPALICLEHIPPASKKTDSNKAPVLLVGKAITFDTGGYSIKPSANMDAMKYDKCGGMAVIGAMEAVAALKLPIPVVGLIPTAENMVDTKAYRPGDILTCYNGVTVEVTNTDAEGRLVLADALAYGTKKYKPRAAIDLATLTGGVVVALGSFCAGCFCSDSTLRSRLFDAGDAVGERLWHLPLWDEHRQMLKGTHGDIVNSGGRGAHPIQGAAFLSYFIGDEGPTQLSSLPWAHLDIAGVSDLKEAKSPWCKGPTGFGVRLLVKMLEGWK